MLDPALLIGRAVYACTRGHESHEPGPCRTTVQRGFLAGTCGEPTAVARHEPSALALALTLRNTARAALESERTPERESLAARMERRLVEAAMAAGLSWDEARML